MVTGDAWADANALYDREAEYEERLPTCDCCGEHIVEDHLYDFDGELVCEECLHDYIVDNFRKSADEYIDEFED